MCPKEEKINWKQAKNNTHAIHMLLRSEQVLPCEFLRVELSLEEELM